MLYDQYFIDDLKDRADLVRIIEPYARDLKKKGANWMACCPFHQEKTPSFSVNPQKGFYKCFGCGKGGNAFTFLMEMEGLNFPEAIERVAEMAGVPLPERIDDGQYQQSKERKKEQKVLSDLIVELNRTALKFWEEQLGSKNSKVKSKKSQEALDYLRSRGITDEVITQFRIGFAPDSWDELYNVLKATGVDESIIRQSGLVSINEEKDRVFDRFRGRIIFPVLDVNGDPVAFGARAMGDDQPKYLNSPETPAYVKGKHLYGLFQSKEAIRQKKFAILVEGYLDLIALYQFGVTNVAASLGTAFTADQSKLLSRFTKKLVINYDGDSAGLKAARRAIEELLPNDIEIKVLVLPDGQDPDDFIRANGPEGYNRARGRAASFLNFTFDAATRDRAMANPKQKAEAIEEVMPVLTAIKNPIQKRESFDQAMDFFRVDDNGLKRDLWRAVKDGGQVAPETVKREVKRVTQAKMTVAEQHLLELLVHDAELRERILPILEESDYDHLATASIFRALYALQDSGEELDMGALLDITSDDEIASDFVPILMMSEQKRGDGEVLDDVFHDAENCLFSLRSMAIQNRIHEVSQDLLVAEQTGDAELVNQLVLEHLDLSKMKHSLLSKLRET